MYMPNHNFVMMILAIDHALAGRHSLQVLFLSTE